MAEADMSAAGTRPTAALAASPGAQTPDRRRQSGHDRHRVHRQRQQIQGDREAERPEKQRLKTGQVLRIPEK